jgi:hypothetical protein
MKKKYTMKKLISRITLGALLVSLCSLTSITNAQSQKHHISVLNTTHVDFEWRYVISPTTYKNIEYFIVEATGGVIKVAFNACDVCYSNYLGYSQVGVEMKCNNCGNQYAINQLGTSGTGGCWPGYLPHTVVGDSIVINHTDLMAGAYYFQLLTNGVGIEDVNNSLSYSLVKTQSELVITMNSINNREVTIFNINGKQIYSESSSDAELRINIDGLSSGVYIVSVKENGKLNNQKIFID